MDTIFDSRPEPSPFFSFSSLAEQTGFFVPPPAVEYSFVLYPPAFDKVFLSFSSLAEVYPPVVASPLEVAANADSDSTAEVEVELVSEVTSEVEVATDFNVASPVDLVPEVVPSSGSVGPPEVIVTSGDNNEESPAPPSTPAPAPDAWAMFGMASADFTPGLAWDEYECEEHSPSTPEVVEEAHAAVDPSVSSRLPTVWEEEEEAEEGTGEVAVGISVGNSTDHEFPTSSSPVAIHLFPPGHVELAPSASSSKPVADPDCSLLFVGWRRHC